MAKTKRLTDPIRVLSTETIAQIFRYNDLGRDMAPRQVSKTWREKLSEGVVIEDVLNSFFTKNDPPLICESWLDSIEDAKAINLKKLEVLHRFRNGKPAKTVTLDLPKEFLHHNDVGIRLWGTKAIIIIPTCPKDFPRPERNLGIILGGSMPLVLLLMDLLTGGLSVIAKCDIRFTTYQSMQKDTCTLQLHNSNLCEMMDLETRELHTVSPGSINEWHINYASLSYLIFRPPGDLHRVLKILVWSVAAKRFCVYELDLSTLVDDFTEKSGGQLVLARLTGADDSINMCIRMAVPDERFASLAARLDREYTTSTCIVTIKTQLGKDLESWSETPGDYCRQLIPGYLAGMHVPPSGVNGQDTFSILRVEDLASRSLDLGVIRNAYNSEGSYVFAHNIAPGGGGLLLNPITGEVRYIYQGEHKAFHGHTMAGTWKGIRYEAGHALGTVKKSILEDGEKLEPWIPNEAAGGTDVVYRPKVLSSRCIALPPDSMPDLIDRERRKERGGDESRLCQWWPGDVKCNDRFLLLAANGRLVIASFDPDWNLGEDDFEPWDVNRPSVFHDLHAEDSSEEIEDAPPDFLG